MMGHLDGLNNPNLLLLYETTVVTDTYLPGTVLTRMQLLRTVREGR
jgi:hypothetical protein